MECAFFLFVLLVCYNIKTIKGKKVMNLWQQCINFINNAIFYPKFISRCQNGALAWVVYMVETHPQLLEILDETDFGRICAAGHLDVVKWVFKQKKPKIDLHWGNEDIFRTVCGKGHLEVAQWLLETEPTINLNADYYGNAFENACANGHLEVAQWLHTLNPAFEKSEFARETKVSPLTPSFFKKRL